MSDKLPKKIITVVEAIHNGITKNSTYYPADKLESSTETWQSPYNKPVLKNHDTWTEPLGRVVKAEFKKSIINPEQFTIQLHLEISDADTIEKILDGRYQTLSIGGSTDSCTCNICGKDILKEGYCGHWKGKTYEGKQAYWTIGNMDFEEISFVNVPADGNAQIVIKSLETKGSKSKESTEGSASNVLDLDNIDKLAEGKAKAEPEVPVVADPPATEPVKENAEPPVARTLESVEAELATVKESLKTAEAKVTDLEGQVTTLTEAKTTAEKRVAELEVENTQQFTQNVELAKAVRSVLAESVADVRIALGKDQLEDREANVAEFSKSNAKALSTQLEGLRQEKPARVVTPVTNPGAANANDPNDVQEGKKDDGELNLAKMAEAMEKALWGNK